jgi:HK97 family phage prohead protease
MPYYISDKQDDCSGWATIKIEDGEPETLGCHASKADAVDQMVALSLAEKIEAGGEYDSNSVRAVAVYKPTQGMKTAAARALRWKKEGKATGAGTPVGWGRATDIVSGRSMSLSVVKRMYSFFSRHEVDKKGKDFYNTDNPSNGRIMWDAWGGDAGFTWSRGIVDRESDKQRNLMTDVVLRANSRAEKIMASLRRINGLKPEPETRVSNAEFEIRAVGDKLTFSGYAAVFNSDSQPLPFIERIAPGAFKRSLQSRNDVKLLWNHDSGEPLASTRSGTMRLVEDSKGLRVEAELAPTTRGKDLSILMERGDIDKMSFGFNVQSDSWSPDGNIRTLESVRLLEVSIVTFPAYESSVAQVRSINEIEVDKLSDALLALETEDALTPDQADLLQNVIKQMTKGEKVEEPVVEEVKEEPKPEVNLLVLKQLKHELEGKML